MFFTLSVLSHNNAGMNSELPIGVPRFEGLREEYVRLELQELPFRLCGIVQRELGLFIFDRLGHHLIEILVYLKQCFYESFLR